MILDLEKFVREERPYWEELDSLLSRMAQKIEFALDMAQARRLFYLYSRTASDLARLGALAGDPAVRLYLEDLVGRAYAEIHETRDKPYRLKLRKWFFIAFPQTFRRHYRAFLVSVAMTLAGCLFGAGALLVDPEAKAVLLPFSHLQGDPSERVAEEEQQTDDYMEGSRSSFAAMLMTNNIKVSILAMALGISWGFGSIIMLFYNGVILGGVMLDYIRAGETVFLAGWLLPHGAIEIPAILLAGQAGLVLGHAMVGWNSPHTMRERLRRVGPDLITLISGVMLLLVWAGIVEAFFSQYHEPVIPYVLKIGFGVLELGLLALFLTRSGVRTAHSGSTQEAP